MTPLFLAIMAVQNPEALVNAAVLRAREQLRSAEVRGMLSISDNEGGISSGEIHWAASNNRTYFQIQHENPVSLAGRATVKHELLDLCIVDDGVEHSQTYLRTNQVLIHPSRSPSFSVTPPAMMLPLELRTQSPRLQRVVERPGGRLEGGYRTEDATISVVVALPPQGPRIESWTRTDQGRNEYAVLTYADSGALSTCEIYWDRTWEATLTIDWVGSDPQEELFTPNLPIGAIVTRYGQTGGPDFYDVRRDGSLERLSLSTPPPASKWRTASLVSLGGLAMLVLGLSLAARKASST
jgi:hypothetical protein